MGFPDMDELLEPDSDLFWRVRAGIRALRLAGHFHEHVDLDFVVSTDGHGFRSMPHVENPRARVLFVGDSTTFGIGVGDQQTYASLIQSLLPDVACANAGVPGYTAYQVRKALERMRGRSKADVTVIAVGLNDAEHWDDRSDAEHDEIYSRAARWDRVGLVRLFRLILPRRAPPAPEWGKRGRPRLSNEEFEEQLTLAVEGCRSRGSRPVLVLWPYVSQMSSQPITPKQRVIRRVARLQDVPLLDMLPLFREAGGRALFCDLVHANEAGNAVAAQALAGAIGSLLGMPIEGGQVQRRG
jgi:lysophospholipase L1-like esterase